MPILEDSVCFLDLLVVQHESLDALLNTKDLK